LIDARKYKLWPGDNPLSELTDAAFITYFMSFAHKSKHLLEMVVPDTRSQTQAVLDFLLAQYVEAGGMGGWPAHGGGAQLSLSATACVLLALEASSYWPVSFAPHVAKAERYMLSKLGDGRILNSLTAWDWSLLAHLAKMKMPGNVSVWNSQDFALRVREVRYLALSGKLTQRSLSSIPPGARIAVAFANSRGNPQKIASGHLEALFNRWPQPIRYAAQKVVDNMIAAVCGLVAGSLLALWRLF
jgi:hypothetical protein